MYHPTYLLLAKPFEVNPTGDPEASEFGFTLSAPVLKIVKTESFDELHKVPHIVIYYGYGYVSKRNEFKLLEDKVYQEIVVDIATTSGDTNSTFTGINPVNRKQEKSGPWLTNLLSWHILQPHRQRGDYRIIDLYEFLLEKLEIGGEIIYTESK